MVVLSVKGRGVRKGFVLYLFIGLVSQKNKLVCYRKVKGQHTQRFASFTNFTLITLPFSFSCDKQAPIVLGLFYKLNMVVMSGSVGEGWGREKVQFFICLHGWFLKTINCYVVKRSQGNKRNVFIRFTTLRLYIVFNVANEKKT